MVGDAVFRGVPVAEVDVRLAVLRGENGSRGVVVLMTTERSVVAGFLRGERGVVERTEMGSTRRELASDVGSAERRERIRYSSGMF